MSSMVAPAGAGYAPGHVVFGAGPAPAHLSLLARGEARRAEPRSGGPRQVLRRGGDPRRPGRRAGDRQGDRGGRRGSRADAASRGLRAPGRAHALRAPVPGALRRARDESLHRGRQADQGQRGRGDPPHRHLPHRRRGGAPHPRRGPADGHLAAGARLHRPVEARADRALLVHLAVQLPAQSGRPQDGARPGRRLPVRPEAGEPDPDRGAAHRRDPGRDRAAPRRLLRPPLPARRRRSLHHRRAPQAAQLHRLARGRLGAQGPGRK